MRVSESSQWLCVLALPARRRGAGSRRSRAARRGTRSRRRGCDRLRCRSGADATRGRPDGTTALHWAAYYGDAKLVQALLAAKADPNARNDFGSTPLAEAAAIGRPKRSALLLKAGADVESANPEGQTALMAVARTGNVEAARLLLKARAKVDAREQWGGQTALMWAAARGQPDMVRLLLAHGADVDARGSVRDWERHVTAEPRPKGMNRGGFTPLLYAAREGCVACARRLLAGKADIDLADPDGITPLLLAMLNLRFDVAKLLIEAGRRREPLGLLRPDAAVRRDRHEHAAARRPPRPAVRRSRHRRSRSRSCCSRRARIRTCS